MFITSAFAADTAAAAPAPDSMAAFFQATPLLPLLLVFVVFYFIVIRPQNARAKEHRNMIAALEKGDKVVTGGGLIATVKKIVSDDEIVLELANGVEVHAVRSMILAKKG
jgi:preprotein translocase subunit YajC